MPKNKKKYEKEVESRLGKRKVTSDKSEPDKPAKKQTKLNDWFIKASAKFDENTKESENKEVKEASAKLDENANESDMSDMNEYARIFCFVTLPARTFVLRPSLFIVLFCDPPCFEWLLFYGPPYLTGLLFCDPPLFLSGPP